MSAEAPSAGYVTLQEALPELASPVSGGFSAPSSRAARTAIAMIVGLLLGMAAVLIAERLDTRLNTNEAVQAAFGLPVIAEVPRVTMREGTIVTSHDPASAAAEAYRTLRASLVLMPTTIIGGREAGTRGEPQVILVTSPAPGDGKTTTVANLAVCFAEAGRSVLVLGCDFRRPEIHKYFGVDPRPGISEVLMDTGRELASVVRPTITDGVTLAPSGSALRNFGDVANAGRALIEVARELADVVIVDTAPILATNDATELIPVADAVVVVARVGKTSGDSARRTQTLLARLSAEAAGIVVIGGTPAEASYSDYYTTHAPEVGALSGWRRRKQARRGDGIAGRIEPWHGVAPKHPRAEPRTSTPQGRPPAGPLRTPAPMDAPTPGHGGSPARAPRPSDPHDG